MMADAPVHSDSVLSAGATRIDASTALAPPCPNCAAPVSDAYCARCGQRYADSIPSLRRMAAEFVDDQFSVNGTLPRSVGWLVFRPGFLTREYSQGRIARYIRPFRLFLGASVLLLLALTSLADTGRMMSDFETRVGDPATFQEQGSWNNVQIPVDTTWGPGWVKPVLHRVAAQRDRLNALPPEESLRVVMDSLLETVPRLALVLLPIFAAMLRVLHFRLRPKYVEHFVFALHYHAMAFLLLAAALAVGTDLLLPAVMAWITVYLLIALRVAYSQSWALTVVKFLVIVSVYPVVLAVGVGLTSVLAILTA